MLHQTIVIAIFLFSVSLGQAEQEKKMELPKSGVLSSVGHGLAGGSVSSTDPWGGTDTSGEELPPLSGGMSKTKDSWNVRVQNNTDEPYHASFEVVQFDHKRSILKRDSFSASLKPREVVTRSFSADRSGQGGELRLSSWKNLAPKKKDPQKVQQSEPPKTVR